MKGKNPLSRLLSKATFSTGPIKPTTVYSGPFKPTTPLIAKQTFNYFEGNLSSLISPAMMASSHPEMHTVVGRVSKHEVHLAPRKGVIDPPTPSEVERLGLDKTLKDHTKPISDHSPFVVHLAIEQQEARKRPVLVKQTPDNRDLSTIQIAVLNMMMRGVKKDIVENGVKVGERYNNAFKLEESAEQYRARIDFMMQRLGEFIYKKPSIDMMCFQEAPVNKEDIHLMRESLEKYLPPSFQVELSGTKWGIMLVANANKYPGLTDPSRMRITASGPMQDRLVSIMLDDFCTELLMLHAPHQKPEEALHKLEENMEQFIKDSIMKVHESFSVFMLGDFNLSQEPLQKVPEVVFHRLFHEGVGVTCDISVYSSPKGHKVASGERKTVDHALGATFKFDVIGLLEARDILTKEAPEHLATKEQLLIEVSPKPRF